MSVQEIKEQALKLSADDREWLAQELFRSVPERQITPEEGAEWLRRLEDLESGRVKGIPWEEVKAGLRERLTQPREHHLSS